MKSHNVTCISYYININLTVMLGGDKWSMPNAYMSHWYSDKA